VAFLSTRTGRPELWRAGPDGSDALRLTHFEGPALGAPDWSPEGGRIAFEAYVDGQADVYAIDAAGGRPVRLTTAAAHDRTPRWSRDGRWLYFSSDRTGASEIWKVPAGGGEAVQVTRDGGVMAMESVDGGTLYFTRPGEPGLWSMPQAGGAARRVAAAPEFMDWGNWAVTEAGLFLVDRTDGAPRLLRLDPTSGSTAYLAVDLQGLAFGEPGLAVSRDGRAVFFARTDRVESDLMQVVPLP
jgi:dipeptidyl aminopeptidase/acylaminoacyl peptidase